MVTRAIAHTNNQKINNHYDNHVSGEHEGGSNLVQQNYGEILQIGNYRSASACSR